MSQTATLNFDHAHDRPHNTIGSSFVRHFAAPRLTASGFTPSLDSFVVDGSLGSNHDHDRECFRVYFQFPNHNDDLYGRRMEYEDAIIKLFSSIKQFLLLNTFSSWSANYLSQHSTNFETCTFNSSKFFLRVAFFGLQLTDKHFKQLSTGSVRDGRQYHVRKRRNLFFLL